MKLLAHVDASAVAVCYHGDRNVTCLHMYSKAKDTTPQPYIDCIMHTHTHTHAHGGHKDVAAASWRPRGADCMQ